MNVNNITDSCVNLEKSNQLKNGLPKNDDFEKFANFMHAFCTSSRSKILFLLLDHKLCVCEISDVLNLSVSLVSHQLKYLTHLNIVKSIRFGKEKKFELVDNHIKEIILSSFKHVTENNENI